MINNKTTHPTFAPPHPLKHTHRLAGGRVRVPDRSEPARHSLPAAAAARETEAGADPVCLNAGTARHRAGLRHHVCLLHLSPGHVHLRRFSPAQLPAASRIAELSNLTIKFFSTLSISNTSSSLIHFTHIYIVAFCRSKIQKRVFLKAFIHNTICKSKTNPVIQTHSHAQSQPIAPVCLVTLLNLTKLKNNNQKTNNKKNATDNGAQCQVKYAPLVKVSKTKQS